MTVPVTKDNALPSPELRAQLLGLMDAFVPLKAAMKSAGIGWPVLVRDGDLELGVDLRRGIFLRPCGGDLAVTQHVVVTGPKGWRVVDELDVALWAHVARLAERLGERESALGKELAAWRREAREKRYARIRQGGRRLER